MAKDKVKTIKLVRDDATAKEAMAIVGKPLAAVNKRFDELASAPTEGAAQRGVCAAMYAWGLSIKATGKAAFDEKLYNDRFDDYVTRRWSGAKAIDKPSDGTIKGYRSQYGAFAKAAWAPFDAADAVRENIAIANVQMPWRASRMREISKLEAKPNNAALAKMLTITEAAGTVAVRSGASVYLSLVNALVDAAKHTGLRDYLATDTAAAKWLRPALMGATDARNIDANKKNDGKEKTRLLQSVTAARAVLNGKRANVATSGNA